MPIRIHLFAGLADEIGETPLAMDLPESGLTVQDLKAELVRRHPGADRWVRQSLTSVNRTFAPDDQLLRDGDEISLIPPLSGG
ncbi:MoaD/ThiS family protein [Gorillibacterium timonense]|uniref:MoaD/ThiS family protein n=1 Tax=Gorillibacterium timonense TaxID=1689269 RepID=UPI00071E0649|nr:MoaD/ThiS family protein [Gorillibacterium timonense]